MHQCHLWPSSKSEGYIFRVKCIKLTWTEFPGLKAGRIRRSAFFPRTPAEFWSTVRPVVGRASVCWRLFVAEIYIRSVPYVHPLRYQTLHAVAMAERVIDPGGGGGGDESGKEQDGNFRRSGFSHSDQVGHMYEATPKRNCSPTLWFVRTETIVQRLYWCY